METSSSQNKRLVKNTLLLYMRMLFTMIVGLFTSRIVLQELGVVDYGIYNVVGGIVTLFAFVKQALGNATWRYINVSLGMGNLQHTQKVYSNAIVLHALLCVFIFLIAETIGLWFLYNKLVIPFERLDDAFWVYQISVVTIILSIMSAPNMSLITAHEKMGAFAYIAIWEVTAKILLVISLMLFDGNKLILYSFFCAIVQISINAIYYIYCRKKFEESAFVWTNDYKQMKEMSTFTGYTIIPGIGFAASGQGINMLLNIFFGPVVNAARGISVQVQGIIMKFVSSYQMAVNPQITKLYTTGEYERMHSLVTKTAKFSFYILFLLDLPLIMNMDYVLTLWLHSYPDYASIFCKFTLVYSMFDVIAYPFLVGAAANGNVGKYYTINGGILISILPAAYIALRLGGSPTIVYVLQFIFLAILMCVRVFWGANMIEYKKNRVIKEIFMPLFTALIVSVMASYYICNMFEKKDFITFFVQSVIIVIVSVVSILFIGMNFSERLFLKKIFLKKIIHR